MYRSGHTHTHTRVEKCIMICTARKVAVGRGRTYIMQLMLIEKGEKACRAPKETEKQKKNPTTHTRNNTNRSACHSASTCMLLIIQQKSANLSESEFG